MEPIDVHDLPEPMARAIRAMLEELRRQLGPGVPKEEAKELPRWAGQVLGNLTRDEVYDNGCRPGPGDLTG
jgi:hypothetical protein